MSATTTIKKCLIEKGLKTGALADLLGENKTTFYNKISRDTMKYNDVEKIADVLGCDVVFRDRNTGKILY